MGELFDLGLSAQPTGVPERDYRLRKSVIYMEREALNIPSLLEVSRVLAEVNEKMQARHASLEQPLEIAERVDLYEEMVLLRTWKRVLHKHRLRLIEDRIRARTNTDLSRLDTLCAPFHQFNHSERVLRRLLQNPDTL